MRWIRLENVVHYTVSYCHAVGSQPVKIICAISMQCLKMFTCSLFFFQYLPASKAR
jgi:hypothetical protein